MKRPGPESPAPRDGLSGSGAVLHRHRHQPALDRHGRNRRRQRRRHLADRLVRVLSSASAFRDGTFLALPAGRRHVRLDQARLRRISRLHDRLDVLGQQSPLLSRRALFRRQQRTIYRTSKLAITCEQQNVFPALRAAGAGARHVSECHRTFRRQMAAQSGRHRHLAADRDSFRHRRHCLAPIRLRHKIHRRQHDSAHAFPRCAVHGHDCVRARRLRIRIFSRRRNKRCAQKSPARTARRRRVRHQRLHSWHRCRADRVAGQPGERIARHHAGNFAIRGARRFFRNRSARGAADHHQQSRRARRLAGGFGALAVCRRTRSLSCRPHSRASIRDGARRTWRCWCKLFAA